MTGPTESSASTVPARRTLLRVDQVAWVNGSGRALPAAFRKGRLFTPPGSAPYDLVQLNHYALGSMESYILKCDRGARTGRLRPLICLIGPTGIFPMSKTRRSCATPRRARRWWRNGCRPRAWPNSYDARAWRKARFAQLMAQDESWRSLYGRLMMTGQAVFCDAEDRTADLGDGYAGPVGCALRRTFRDMSGAP